MPNPMKKCCIAYNVRYEADPWSSGSGGRDQVTYFPFFIYFLFYFIFLVFFCFTFLKNYVLYIYKHINYFLCNEWTVFSNLRMIILNRVNILFSHMNFFEPHRYYFKPHEKFVWTKQYIFWTHQTIYLNIVWTSWRFFEPCEQFIWTMRTFF